MKSGLLALAVLTVISAQSLDPLFRDQVEDTAELAPADDETFEPEVTLEANSELAEEFDEATMPADESSTMLDEMEESTTAPDDEMEESTTTPTSEPEESTTSPSEAVSGMDPDFAEELDESVNSEHMDPVAFRKIWALYESLSRHTSVPEFRKELRRLERPFPTVVEEAPTREPIKVGKLKSNIWPPEQGVIVKKSYRRPIRRYRRALEE